MRKMIALGVVGFVVFVLMKAPASLLLPYMAPSKHFQVQNIEGSIFSARLKTMGKIDSITYQVNPWQLLSANLSLDVQVRQKKNTLKGEVVIDLINKVVRIKQATGALNLTFFQQYFPPLSTIELHGEVLLKGMDAVWHNLKHNQIPQQLSGNVTLLKLNILEQQFGDYQLDIHTKSDNIIGALTSKTSKITDTKIAFNVLSAKKQLSISGSIKGNNPDVKAIVEQLGIANIKQVVKY